MTVGERIKKIRNKLGMSQVDFADKIILLRIFLLIKQKLLLNWEMYPLLT